MDMLIQNLQDKGATVQAVAVTVGGLAGVFITLAAFFLFVFIAERVGKKKT